jgi:hypothetical protein
MSIVGVTVHSSHAVAGNKCAGVSQPCGVAAPGAQAGRVRGPGQQLLQVCADGRLAAVAAAASRAAMSSAMAPLITARGSWGPRDW